MRRADRLFQIVQHLRGRRLTTAAQLAAWLQVSERTIYRDIQDLSLSGVPVQGEAGVGYRLDRSFDVPPIMFTFDEVQALVAGARMIEAWAGPGLASASRSAIAKIAGALPPHRREEIHRTRLFAPVFQSESAEALDTVRESITGRRKLRIGYTDAAGNVTDRVIRPLGLYFWGNRWTIAAWCEVRVGFRSFRPDRISSITPLEEHFLDEPGKTIDDFIERVERPAT